MIHFRILKQSSKSRARLGILKTPHGEVETPTLVAVATQGVIKTLSSEEVAATGSQILIANTYHLHIRPGESVIKSHGSLHTFMHWPKPLMTDSGGFQIFSLGFGRDYGMGKILTTKSGASISEGQQPKLLCITGDGVEFRSYVDGKKIFLGPKESIKIQEKIGADIIFAFDEPTSPIADHIYTKQSLEKTHRWARICLRTKTSDQALYGIVQGGKFKDLRIVSARHIASLPFDGFGIGGEYGSSKRTMTAMLAWVMRELPPEKPRHLLGIGHPDDIPKIIREGVDTFDCIAPTHYARRGVAFVTNGKIDLKRAQFKNDKKPIDPKCACPVCNTYSRSYLHHLLKANEITPLRLLTFHNLWYFNQFITRIREDIKRGKM